MRIIMAKLSKRLGFISLLLAIVLCSGCRSAEAVDWKKMGLKGKFAYARGKSIIILDLSTGKSKTIRAKKHVYVPQLSPNGKMVTFEDGAQIYLINVDGTGLRQLTSGDGHCHYPSWSPDGKKIVFRRGGREEIGGIYTINIDGTDEVRLIADTEEEYYHYPSWSQDGKKIAYIEGIEAIHTINPDGTDKKLLMRSKDIGPLSWSPEGKKIVYSLSSSGSYVEDIYVMNAGGTNIKRLTFTDPKSSYTNYYPIWTPDGRKIIYRMAPHQGGPWHIERYYIMNVDGSNQEKLLSFFVFGS